MSATERRSRQLRDQAANAPAEPLVTPEAWQHGEFGEELREVNGKVQRVLRRFDSVTLERWRREGKLTDGRQEAIVEYQDAHERAFSGGSITTNYSRCGTSRSTNSDAETAKFQNEPEQRLLKHLEQKVMRYRDPASVAVFRAVVLSGETAGAAGRAVEQSEEAAKVAARRIVLDIAYAIAVELGYARPRRAA